MAVMPRDAATVILVRPRLEGTYEMLMTRRPESMKFMGGFFVFPGGAVDDHDQGEAIESLSTLSPDEARERIGEDIEPAAALGLYCAAARELFEEVGILLARDADGKPVDPVRVREDYAQRRAAFAEDAETFAEFLNAEGLVLATDRLVWHGRLITPEASPIRFDARFFVASCPQAQTPVLDPKEVPEAVWISPAEAIRASGEKRLAIPIPTMAIVQGLSEVPAYEHLLRGARVSKEILSAPLSPLVSYVLAPNPGPMTGPGTNTYIVGNGETVIIDPAVPDGVYIERVAREAAARGRPVLILLTHMHPDHTGGASVLAEQIGCPVGAWKDVDDALVTRPIEDGEVIRAGDVTLRAMYTPGHASHHVCFFLEEERSVFAGDVVAGLGTVVIAPPDGNMRDYLETLDRLAATGLERLYPAHGASIEDGQGKLAEYIAHRKEREGQVLDALEAGVPEIPSIVKRIYIEVPEVLHPMAELSVLAHLEMLEQEGRVARQGDAWKLVVPSA
jgi:glyoxylase-like metal-dependent hydrolase (beta-lactamase superfamily II)/8-oxo-dGTP pyrophosphatase MutT (NUDIX family)